MRHIQRYHICVKHTDHLLIKGVAIYVPILLLKINYLANPGREPLESSMLVFVSSSLTTNLGIKPIAE